MDQPASAILDRKPLGFPWVTVDPFLFCVHHDDAYPAGNERMGPVGSLAGRDLGQDFAGKDGFRMYHGREVPGFPQHPHRGFETVTIVRRGYIDHSDSLGAAARFGGGDVQWLTAGAGVVHSEMFPLLEPERPNPLELFQIWLNLPAEDKFAEPHFTMLWNQDLPRHEVRNAAGKLAEVTVVAGVFDRKRPPPPPPKSWAARARADVAIWCVRMEPGATLTLPPAMDAAVRRTLYFFAGGKLLVDAQVIDSHCALALRADASPVLAAGDDAVELLVLQGRPIGEPVVQYGPFVMNTREQIQQAMQDYQRTQFGGWPWPKDDPVHARDEGRFARQPDGQVQRFPR